jgi:hypothetical protein
LTCSFVEQEETIVLPPTISFEGSWSHEDRQIVKDRLAVLFDERMQDTIVCDRRIEFIAGTVPFVAFINRQGRCWKRIEASSVASLVENILNCY